MAAKKKRKTPKAVDGAKRELPRGVKLIRTLEGHERDVMTVAFDRQGGMLASGSADKTVKLWDARTGELLRTLDGHTQRVNSVEFDPQSGTVASGSDDATIKLWDARSGELLRTLEGHDGSVFSVAFDPQDGMLASGSWDDTVKLWEARSGKLIRTLERHTAQVLSVAFDPQGGMLASGSTDTSVKLWEARSGKLLRTLEGHTDIVFSVAFDPQGRTLASGSRDNTVKLWDAQNGKLLRTLEGHTDRIDIVAFSPDGRLLASKSGDQTIRVWNCETWETVAVIPSSMGAGEWIPALAFHPTLPLLAVANSEPDAPEEEKGRQIHLWELDYDALLGKGAEAALSSRERTASYALAKVLLVGDTGVGKTGLAERLVHQHFVLTESTHGRKVHTFGSTKTTGDHGEPVQREIVLWDLAGQPGYRLIHQLQMEDASVALVLFDARSETDPFGGALYWSEALDQALAMRISNVL